MLVREPGSVMEVNPVVPVKAYGSIIVTPSVITVFLQPEIKMVLVFEPKVDV